MIRITCDQDGFRRAGMAHPKGTSEYPDDQFSENQLVQLQAEPKLTVEIVEDGSEKDPLEPVPQKQLNVGDTVKLVMACNSAEELAAYAADERKGVKDAIQKRGQELAAAGSEGTDSETDTAEEAEEGSE